MQFRSILETRMAVAGKSIMEHNEILGMDAALRFINQSVAYISYFTLQVRQQSQMPIHAIFKFLFDSFLFIFKLL